MAVVGDEVAAARERGDFSERHGGDGVVGVAEHLVEEGLGEGVEVGEGLAAFCAEVSVVIEDRGLMRRCSSSEGRGIAKVARTVGLRSGEVGAGCSGGGEVDHGWLCQVVGEVSAIEVAARG